MQLFLLVKNAGAEQYTSRQDSLDSAPEVVPLVDAPSSRAADYAYDVDAAPEARRARRRRRRDNTLASPRRTIRALAAVGVGATVEKPVKWT